MQTFDPQIYGPAVAPLLAWDGLMELGRGTPNNAARRKLDALTPASVAPEGKVADLQMAQACLAGLWLAHNFLEESHAISQEIPTATGSYWHGIMHRREPDFSNAKYWFRRVGRHPVFEPLSQAARELAERSERDSLTSFLASQASWDPFPFVDLCEAALRGANRNEELCRQIAEAEWRLLFDFCWRAAFTPSGS